MAIKTAKGLALTCPFCGSEESIALDLNDLEACSCSSCSEDFTPAKALTKATELVARWTNAIAWIDSAPVTR